MIITTVTTDSGKIIPLGRQIEENAHEIWFDLTWLINNFGEGEAELVHQRSKDAAPYPCVTTRENNTLIWKINNIDTEYDGFGRAEIRWTFGNGRAKTVIYRTNVLQSLTADITIPEPYESWYDAMIEYIDQLKVDSDERLVEAVESASNSASTATTKAEEASTSADEAADSATQADSAATQASQSATNAATSAAEAAESAKQTILSATVTVTPVVSDGNLTFNAAIEGGN